MLNINCTKTLINILIIIHLILNQNFFGLKIGLKKIIKKIMEKINNKNQKIKRGNSENPNEELSSKTNNQNEILTSISNLKIENKKLKEELLKHKNYSKYLSSKKCT